MWLNSILSVCNNTIYTSTIKLTVPEFNQFLKSLSIIIKRSLLSWIFMIFKNFISLSKSLKLKQELSVSLVDISDRFSSFLAKNLSRKILQ